MPNLHDDQAVLQKLEQAIQDLGELDGEGAPQRQKLMQFLREAVEECREHGRTYDRHLAQQFSPSKEHHA